MEKKYKRIRIPKQVSFDDFWEMENNNKVKPTTTQPDYEIKKVFEEYRKNWK